MSALASLSVASSYLDQVGARCRRFGQVLEQCGRRRDFVERQAQVLLLLMAVECPLTGTPRRDWYVRGAVARFGWRSIQRAWEGFFGEQGPTQRTIQEHLRVLEAAGLILRSPGDPTNWGDPTKPAHARTIWLLRSDQEQRWWATAGRERLEQHPEAAVSAAAWRRLFGRWRDEAQQLGLSFIEGGQGPGEAASSSGGGATVSAHPPLTPSPASLEAIATCIRERAVGQELLARLRRAGVGLARGRGELLAQNAARLRGAAALLLRALRRGDEIDNPAGWLVHAWKHAPPRERDAAVRALG